MNSYSVTRQGMRAPEICMLFFWKSPVYHSRWQGLHGSGPNGARVPERL